MLRLFLNQRRRRAEAGFTLIELVVVLAVLGILLALAVPRYVGARKRAYRAEIDNIFQEVKTLSWAYYNEYNLFPTSPTDISLLIPGGAAWDTPVIVAGSGGSNGFVQWAAGGLPGGAPVEPADTCSLTLSTTGQASLDCNF